VHCNAPSLPSLQILRNPWTIKRGEKNILLIRQENPSARRSLSNRDTGIIQKTEKRSLLAMPIKAEPGCSGVDPKKKLAGHYYGYHWKGSL
jgi:hypothetical protein